MLKGRTSWIFDLDGTLTLPVHDFAHIRQELGMAPEVDILATIEQYSGEEKRTMLARLDELERHYAALAKPAEGALDLLEMLKLAGHDLGILTRNTKEMALLSLQSIGAGDYFSEADVLGREESEPKPSPDGINYLINQWNSSANDAVMVGDFHFDLLCGAAAGVKTVHVDKRERHWPEVTDVRVYSLSELILLLK